ncbi:LicD family protein [uncultured Bacteroides sp.]|uniref:LicD family protein n=1 Tax=uncultured Bacteroides sp. TaxID=162156 RepID=UPI0025FED9F4|nr:LicD family protein [uncultured Bacteroides sp.]
MEEIGIEELKKLQLDILINVRDFCDAKGIMYYLAYGTLLGAVRHKGYIPWDDDIDIMMPREDYNRFLKEFNGYYKDLEVLAPELDLNYYAPYANVVDKRTLLVEQSLNHKDIGVKIDIFPIENIPDDEVKYQRICKESESLNRMRSSKVACLSFYKGSEWLKLAIKKFLYSLKSFSKIQKRIIDLAKKSNFGDDRFVDCIVFITIKNRKFPRTCIQGFELMDFENQKFKIPKDYDKCLKALFGNYMQLPPVEKRVMRHNFKAYWK